MFRSRHPCSETFTSPIQSGNGWNSLPSFFIENLLLLQDMQFRKQMMPVTSSFFKFYAIQEVSNMENPCIQFILLVLKALIIFSAVALFYSLLWNVKLVV